MIDDLSHIIDSDAPVERQIADVTFSRRKILAASVSATVTGLAGCSIISSGTKVNKVTLDIFADQSATLTLDITDTIDSLTNVDQPSDFVKVDADIEKISPTEEGNIKITFKDFLRDREYTNDDHVLYSHPAIGFSENVTSQIQDSDAEIQINYPEVGTGNSNDTQYKPQFLFTGDTLDTDYDTIESLDGIGIDERYNADWASGYEAFSSKKGELGFSEVSRITKSNFHDYISEVKGVDPSWQSKPSENENINKYIYKSYSTNQPWTFPDNESKSIQIPGTGVVSHPAIARLQSEALLRDTLSRGIAVLIDEKNTSRADVMDSLDGFLNEVGSTLTSALTFDATNLKDILMFAWDLKQLHQQTKKLTDNLEGMADFDRWTTVLSAKENNDSHISYRHLSALTGIELHNTGLVMMMTTDVERRQHAVSQYHDNLLQQYLVAHVLGELLKDALDNPCPPLICAETSEQKKAAEYSLNVTKEIKFSINRSFGYLNEFSSDDGFTGGLVINSTSIHNDNINANIPIRLTANVENKSNEKLEEDLPVLGNGEPLGTKSITLDRGQAKKIEYEMVLPEPGNYELSVGRQIVDTVTATKAFEVSDLTLARDTVEVSEPVPVTATVENVTEKERIFSLPINKGIEGETTASGGRVGAAETAEFVVYIQYSEPGEYAVSTRDGKELGTVTVTEYNLPRSQNYPMRGYTARNSMYNPDTKVPDLPKGVDTPALRWTFEVNHPDNQFPTRPIVVGEKLFLPNVTELVAVHPGTREELWRSELDGDAAMTPAYHDEMLFQSDYDGNVYAIDPENGKIQARNSMNEHLRALAVDDSGVYGYNEHQDFTYTEETLVRFDSELNKVWEKEVVEGFLDGAPAVGDNIVVVGDGRTTAAYDKENGDEVWRSDRAWSNYPPSIHDGKVYIAGWGDDHGGQTIGAYDIETGELLNGSNGSNSLYTAPQVVDGVVYAGGEKGIHSWDSETFTKQRTYGMTEGDGGGGLFSDGGTGDVGGPFTVTESQVMAIDDEGLVRAFDRENGTVDWNFHLSEPGKSVLTAGGQVFVTTETKYLALS